MSLTLVKIPLSLYLAFELKSILTPPHAPPPQDEVIPTVAIDVPRLRKYRLAFTRIGQLILAAAEITLILAAAFPASPYTQRLLSTLALPTPERLALSKTGALGALLWALGAHIRRRTFRELGRFFRFDISLQRDHALVTTGPYAWVRHPSYTGMLLANAGWLLWTFARGSWVRESGLLHAPAGVLCVLLYIAVAILPTSAVTLARMGREDAALKSRFGKQWEEWYRRTPYAVLPWVY